MKKKILAILFITIGISIMITAVLMKNSSKKVQQNMLEDFQYTMQESKEVINNKSQNENTIKEENKEVVGIMLIPKIDLKVAIGEGVDNETLKYAIGHFKGTAMPGKNGNFCVAGHRSYTYNEYFNRLDEIKIGDEIIVKTHENEFKYKVNEIKVVEPTEVSVLDNTKNSTITLVTCTPIRIATHRLIIKGELVGN